MARQSKVNRVAAIILAIIVVGILAVNIRLELTRMSELSITSESFITSDGTVYDLHEDAGRNSWLRQISPDGRLLQQKALQSGAEQGEVYRNIVDVTDGTIYLFEYEYRSSGTLKPLATIWAYNMNTGTVSRVFSESEPEKTDINENEYVYLVSDKIWDDKLYFGYFSENEAELTEAELTVFCFDIKTKELTTRISPKPCFQISYLHITNDGDIILSSPDSMIWIWADKESKWSPIFDAKGLDAISNISVGHDGTVFAYVVGAEGGQLYQKHPDSDVFAPGKSIPADTMSVELYDNDTWIAVNFEHENHLRSFDIVSNGEMRTLTQLTVPLHLALKGSVFLWIALESLLAAAVILLIRHIYLRKKTRLIITQIIIALPIFATGLILLHNIISDRITDEMYRRTYNESILQAYEIVESIDKNLFLNIDWTNPVANEYYRELSGFLSEYSRSKTIPWQDSAPPYESDKTEYYTSYWLFRVDDGLAYTAFCDNMYINLDSHYIDKDGRYNMIDLLLEQKEITLGNTYGTNGGGYWLNVLHPIMKDGDLIGFLEVGTPTAFVDEAVDRIMASIFIIVGLVLGISLLAYIAVLGLSLRALDILKHGAQKIASGDYSTRVHVSGTDETADIAAAFNQMGESIEESYRHVKAMRDGYRYFVPEKMLAILGRESIAEIAPGHYAHLRAGYLLLSTDSFDAYRDKAFFDALNRFYACVIPHIADTGGIIERYNGRGLAAIFDSSPETALNALISMFAAIDGAGDALRSEGGSAVECHAMLSLSDSLLGVIGNEKRLNMIAISRLTYESERVGRMCRLYGCRVILTQSVYDELGTSVSAFRHRLLGRISDSGQEVSAYDFYDAEIPELMRGKDETRDTFERAVGLYYEGDYAAARRLFIEVIKQSPKDLAAREYLKESHTRMESGLPPKPLLEI